MAERHLKLEIDEYLESEYKDLNIRASEWSIYMLALSVLRVGVDPNSAGVISA